jgi:AhpD family alkylhydroperoxidase
MTRIVPVAAASAAPSEAEAIAEIRAAWGGVPRLGYVFARSAALTHGMLAFGSALQHGAFSGPVAEQIAVANENRCAYCLAAHTAAGRAYGLDEQSLSDARSGDASTPKLTAALRFVQAVVRERGHLSDEELGAARGTGLTDEDLVELVGHAMATTLTNYLHHLSKVPVEFPRVDFAPTTGAREAA